LTGSSDVLEDLGAITHDIGSTLSKIGGPLATGINGLDVAHNLANHNYLDAGFGVADLGIDLSATAVGGVRGAAAAAVLAALGGTKASAAGAMGLACLATGL
jgi:hypothetical protein